MTIISLESHVNNATKTIKVATISPWLYGQIQTNLSKASKSSENKYDLVWSILKELGRMLNIKYEIVNHTEKQLGNFENGTWTGLLKLLKNEEVDILGIPTEVTFDHLDIADYTKPLFQSDYAILIRSPNTFTDNTFFILTAAFNMTAWTMVAALVLFSGCIFYVICHTLKRNNEQQYTFLDACWVFCSIFLQQGLWKTPNSFTGRMFVSLWWLWSITLLAIYSGGMLMTLSSGRERFPFYTLDELAYLVQHSGYKIVTESSSSSHLYIKDSLKDNLKKIWHEMSINKKWINVSSFQDGKDLIINQPRTVLIAPREPLLVLAASDCRVTLAKQSLSSFWCSICTRKNFPFLKEFSEQIELLLQSGFIKKIQREFHVFLESSKKDMMCRQNLHGDGLTETPLNLDEAQGVFWLWLLGTTFSCFVFLLEMITQCKKFIRRSRSTVTRL
ncbi:putative glutamate receptor [Trichinella papuae]|uniref:Putative glutamate receptor n=1 Tax=Trichinella papuae TaxID=268474 RepID=A0A0V1MG94_9BILA|nr:putative glutamate receptor [Trichinella papuae]